MELLVVQYISSASFRFHILLKLDGGGHGHYKRAGHRPTTQSEMRKKYWTDFPGETPQSVADREDCLGLESRVGGEGNMNSLCFCRIKNRVDFEFSRPHVALQPTIQTVSSHYPDRRTGQTYSVQLNGRRRCHTFISIK